MGAKDSKPIMQVKKLGGGMVAVPMIQPGQLAAGGGTMQVKKLGGGMVAVPMIQPGQLAAAAQASSETTETIVTTSPSLEEVQGHVEGVASGQEKVQGQVEGVASGQEKVKGQVEGVASGQEKVVTFVRSNDVLTSLRKTCEKLNKYEEVGKKKGAKKKGAKKEEYQMYNSGEIVGFNLNMK